MHILCAFIFKLAAVLHLNVTQLLNLTSLLLCCLKDSCFFTHLQSSSHYLHICFFNAWGISSSMQKIRLLNLNRIKGQSQILQVEPAVNEGCLNVAKTPSDTSGRYGRTSGPLMGHSLALPTWWATFRLGQYRVSQTVKPSCCCSWEILVSLTQKLMICFLHRFEIMVKLQMRTLKWWEVNFQVV